MKPVCWESANVDLDPNLQMNVWLSSASNHQWNPNQKTPATPWEAEIDRLMQAQAAESESGPAQAILRPRARDRLGAGAVPVPPE